MRLNLLAYYLKRFSWIPYVPFNYKNRINKPIFLLGNQGDGITFVSRILRRNKSTYCITGNKNYWTGADEMCTVCEPLLSKNLRLAGRILKTDPSHEIFTQPRSWSYGSNDLINKYYQDENRIEEEDIKTLKKAINIAAFRFGGHDKRFVDKSQLYTLKSRAIQSILKEHNPYFLLITRNPYISCYRAASGKAGDLKRYSKTMSFDERYDVALQHWKNCMDTIVSDSKHLRNFKVIRFEDFIADVEDSTRTLCHFLNLNYSADMLPQKNQSIPFATKYKTRWYPLKLDVNDKYLDSIDDYYLDKASSYLGESARKFGYNHPRRK